MEHRVYVLPIHFTTHCCVAMDPFFRQRSHTIEKIHFRRSLFSNKPLAFEVYRRIWNECTEAITMQLRKKPESIYFENISKLLSLWRTKELSVFQAIRIPWNYINLIIKSKLMTSPLIDIKCNSVLCANQTKKYEVKCKITRKKRCINLKFIGGNEIHNRKTIRSGKQR